MAKKKQAPAAAAAPATIDTAAALSRDETGFGARAALSAPAPQAAPASHAEFALRALVAAGHITQAKADEAMRIAERVMPQTKEPTNDR